MADSDIPRVLVIAGSDSGGGAGIQADIKACAAFGAYSATAITAITVQNTLGVQQVEMLSPDLVRAQVRAVMSDIGADVIKIGMLGNEAVINGVAEELGDVAALVVLDPVMVATSGDKLLEDSAINALRTKLVPICDVITPNVPEAEILTGQTMENVNDLIPAGKKLLDMGADAALMKGGHMKGRMIVDGLVNAKENSVMTAPRIQSKHTHGTGCTLASSVAACLALGLPLNEAVNAAREYVFEAIRTAPKLGRGNGPLNHGLASPESGDDGAADNPFPAPKN
ncbi:MAG: bifunctional hydroxymethylpyrimidine kinase/phosphomethylpyrimidine kinase [Hyphomonadaceae bacterium]|nr:bifunctional hydroxymethylpyrimidine kinase/phosphomethylpyrimidine kinase [Hyphomonadaceae bacterium]MBC6411448.1 bifunctional hydroxymethylpyrimidine kinase/phosphomethylpyrimidine kinase [Hyphomonadaceae bacterium]